MALTRSSCGDGKFSSIQRSRSTSAIGALHDEPDPDHIGIALVAARLLGSGLEPVAILASLAQNVPSHDEIARGGGNRKLNRPRVDGLECELARRHQRTPCGQSEAGPQVGTPPTSAPQSIVLGCFGTGLWK